MVKHEFWMRRALEEAALSGEDIPVGAIVVKDDRQIAAGCGDCIGDHHAGRVIPGNAVGGGLVGLEGREQRGKITERQGQLFSDSVRHIASALFVQDVTDEAEMLGKAGRLAGSEAGETQGRVKGGRGYAIIST